MLQAVVAPFLVAVAVAALLHRPRLAGLALPAAVAVAVALAAGFSFEPLTGPGQLALAGLACALPVAWIAWLRTGGPLAGAVFAALAGSATFWMLQRSLAQGDAALGLALGVAAALYVAALVEGGRRFVRDPIPAASAALLLGLGFGTLALLGADPPAAQVSAALGAGAAAVLLVQLLAGRSAAPGWSLVLPVAVGGGMTGVLAAVTGTLPWYSLLPVLAAPWAAGLPARARRRRAWPLAVLCCVCGLVPIAAAVALAWLAVRPPA